MKSYPQLQLAFPEIEERYGCWFARQVLPSQSNSNMMRLREEVFLLPWVTKRTARHEYFMSVQLPRIYTYGNRGTGEEVYVAQPFSPWVQRIRQALNEAIGTSFNVCFLNKYDDQHQHLGWHADDFYGMVKEEPIACVSLGAEREIWVKDKRGVPCKMCATWDGLEDCLDCGGTGFEKGKVPPEQRISLPSGSLFIMPPGYQDTHLHRIPKHDRPCGWRISLTFRTFEP